MVRAGDGGDGCVAFRREKFVPRGGPNGGDGGAGGSIYLVATAGLDTLLDFAGRHHWRAERGGDGQGKDCTGKKGEDLHIRVPVGTIVYDLETQVMLKDLCRPGQTICIARGGRCGHGNAFFASPTNQTPRQAEPGKPGQQRRLRLELKLIADVGIAGLPNAGKSTLLARCSAARPKIAPYPFTTLQPNLGIVELSDFRRFVMADIPGLIEGSHLGHGLGHEFLRHIERTRLLLHLVDISGFNGADPVANYHTIRRELAQYSPALADKPEIIVASKTDLDPDGAALDAFRTALGRDVPGISAVTGSHVPQLLEQLWHKVQALRAAEPAPSEPQPGTTLGAPAQEIDPPRET